MPELASAWVTLAVSTRGMESDIRRAIGRVENSARITPRIDTGSAGTQGANAGRQFARRFNDQSSGGMRAAGSSVGKMFVSGLAGMFTGGALLSVAQSAARAVVGEFQNVFETGLSFERTMNNFQGVTRASATEMAAMQAQARALGADTTLAGASSSDAALAMTELAKAGFSVDQAMEAARGTLELATAGQINAAQAAEIQSNAMNAFKLNPDLENAAHVADLLANAAIASSADIPDLGLALQQVGGIAQGFGENLDDTTAALAIFANAGVKGSDAGTLLKTTMQAITDQGNPAQGAIEALNLQLYNFDTHQFVGFRELFRQLDEAKKRLSPEDFQAQTNILFGSDAMRSAMLGNADAFDQMLGKLQRTGAAAEMAKAQMGGLPGAVESLSNTMESVRLDVFDAIGPAATEGLKQLGDALNTHKPEVIGFFTLMAQTVLETGSAIARFSQGGLEALALFTDGTAGMIGRVVDTLGTGARNIGMIIAKIPGMEGVGTSLVMAGAKAEIAGTELKKLSEGLHDSADVAGASADGMSRLAGTIGEAGREAEAGAERTRRYTEAFDTLRGAVEMVPGSKDIILKDNSPEVMQKLAELGFTVQNLPDGRQVIRLEYRDQNGNVIDPAQLRAPIFVPAVPGEARPPRGGGRARGGIFSGLASLFSFGTGGVLPNRAGIQPATSGLVQWAEPSTGGEAFIPLNGGDRSRAIWAQTGHMLGIFEDGGIRGSKANLQPNASQLFDLLAQMFPELQEIGGYRQDPLPDHPSGRALDIMIPNWQSEAGKALGDEINTWLRQNAEALGIDSTIWRDTWADLLGNTSTVSGHQNHIHAKVKAGAATGAALTSMVPAGATTDSALSSIYGYGAPDPDKIADAEENLRTQHNDVLIQEQELRELKADADQSQRMRAEEQLRKAKAEEAKAQRELDEVKRGEPLTESEARHGRSGKTSGDGGDRSGGGLGQSLGEGLISGLLQAIGIDGSVFSNPLEWPNVKSAMAAVNFGGGLLKAVLGGTGEEGATDAPGSGGPALPGLPSFGDFLKPLGIDVTTPLSGTPASGVGSGPAPGPAPGPSIVNNGVIGMDPRQLTQRADAHQNQVYRRNMGAVRP